MRIFFGFRNAEVFPVSSLHDLSKNIVGMLRRQYKRQVESLVVLGHHCVRQIERHKRAGGICYEVCDGQLTETEGGRQRVIMDVAELPGTFGGKARHIVANALATAAACRAVGIPVKDIRGALADFVPALSNPGRGDVYAVQANQDDPATPSRVLVDYGNNAAGEPG